MPSEVNQGDLFTPPAPSRIGQLARMVITRRLRELWLEEWKLFCAPKREQFCQWFPYSLKCAINGNLLPLPNGCCRECGFKVRAGCSGYHDHSPDCHHDFLPKDKTLGKSVVHKDDLDWLEEMGVIYPESNKAKVPWLRYP